MNYQELRSLVGGSNPQDASYQDIISGIQSQYTPQTQFAPTRSLLDSIGATVPDQQRIAYGSLLQAQPRVLPTPMKNVVTDGSSSIDSGLINNIVSDSNRAIDNFNLSNALVNDNKTNTTNTTNLDTSTVTNGLFGTNVTGTDVAKVGSIVAPIAALAGSSDLVKTGIALNLIGSAADIKTEADVLNLGTKIAMLAAGPYGNALALGLGVAKDDTPMTVNALLGLVNPTLGLVNSIVSNLTGNSFGNVVSGLISAPEGSISDLGLLGASNYGNAINRSAADVNDVLRDAITSGQGCPAPWVEILLADGGIVQAGDIKVGMEVYTRHETTNEWGVYPVTAVEMGEDERWEVVLDDGRIFVGTFNHRVHTGDDWTEIRNLKAGDKLVQTDGYGTVQYSKQLDRGAIVKITVADAHTYISEGFLSHNIKIQPTFDSYDFGGGGVDSFLLRFVNAE
jgi:hypothetical protein